MRADGRVVAWGFTARTNVPASATNAIAVAAGYTHALALRADGSVVGWGLNTGGALTIRASATNIVAIAAGYSHSAALRADGRVLLWGSGPTNAPPGLSDMTCFAVAADYNHTAVLVGDGTPQFVERLGSLVAYTNRAFTLNALAVGAPPLTYQWYFNGRQFPAPPIASCA